MRPTNASASCPKPTKFFPMVSALLKRRFLRASKNKEIWVGYHVIRIRMILALSLYIVYLARKRRIYDARATLHKSSNSGSSSSNSSSYTRYRSGGNGGSSSMDGTTTTTTIRARGMGLVPGGVPATGTRPSRFATFSRALRSTRCSVKARGQKRCNCFVTLVLLTDILAHVVLFFVRHSICN